jgi:hypothetical protein
MKTTHTQNTRPPAETNREQAWAHLLEGPSKIRHAPGILTDRPRRQLKEIARRFDTICARASGDLTHKENISETDALAALLVIRALRDKLDRNEYELISLAREHKVTWQRIAHALEMGSRQSAERRHLQLRQAHPRPGLDTPRTQNDQVELERDRRAHAAEQQWALQRAATIRNLATQLAALPDLQQRLDHSQEARLITALHRSSEPSHEPGPLGWATALRRALKEDERFRRAPHNYGKDAGESLDEEKWRQQRAEAELVHRLLGLLGYAARARNVDLSGHEDLARKIVELNKEQMARHLSGG